MFERGFWDVTKGLTEFQGVCESISACLEVFLDSFRGVTGSFMVIMEDFVGFQRSYRGSSGVSGFLEAFKDV